MSRVSKDDQKVTSFVEVGSTGLTRFGGWVNEEWLKDLQGIRGIKAYKEMRDNSAVVGAILFAIKMLIRQVSWRVEAAGTTRQDEEAKAFLESCIEDMETSWHDLITEILSMLPFGWAWHEEVYKRRMGDSRDPSLKSKYDDGRIGWRKIPLRAQETFWQWRFADDGSGDVTHLLQQPPPDYRIREIPKEKSLLFRTESNKNNPEGRSILRNAYRSYYFSKNIEEIEAIGIERDLAGLPYAQVPPEILRPNATPEQKATAAAIQRMVTSIRRDRMEGVVYPGEEDGKGNKTGYKLSLLTTGGRRNFDTTAIIQRYEQRIAMTAMADFILIGHEKVGSFALNSSKTELFAVALGAFIDLIRDEFNTNAVPRLFRLNTFQGLTGLPTLQHGDVETPDLAELGAYVQALSGAQMPLFPDEQLENYLRQAAHWPKKPEGELAPKPKVEDTAQAGDDEVIDAKKFARMLVEVRKELEA
ncbi:MAG: hypothetical protein A4E56_00146 [Pelotomaculum sp. PtaU1.Bin065]|nr:MAG: hypothetical protein A4E56_00146 [Pelotomaculum sp. PtaU1.Bin065]